MAIKVKHIGGTRKARVFKASKLALKYCQGEGLEIGATAHNPFSLPGSKNVDVASEQKQSHQVGLCHAYAEIDIESDGTEIPVDDSSQDYVLASHTLVHMANPIAALAEWVRVVKPSGVVFLIVPQRNAAPKDRKRPVATMKDLQEVNSDKMMAVPSRWVFDMELLEELFDYLAEILPIEVVESCKKDDKVGNGYLFVLRVGKKAEKTPKKTKSTGTKATKSTKSTGTKKPKVSKVVKEPPVKADIEDVKVTEAKAKVTVKKKDEGASGE